MMESRQLGGCGLQVPVLAFGAATFGGSGDFFRAWGETQVEEATRLIDVALEAGVTLFDTAGSYSDGLSEEILGRAIGSRRDQILLATKAGYRTEPGPNGMGASRYHLIRACEASLRRLRTETIDLYQIHNFDALTPVQETLQALDDLVRSGKVRYVGCSNYSGWHLMKSLSLAEKYGLSRFASHQVYYSLADREYEWELMPLALDQKIGTLVWSPLAGARLTGKLRRNRPPPETSRLSTAHGGPPPDERLYRIIDAMDEIAAETGKTLPQIALNWLLQRPTVSSIILGARNEAQLRDNLGAVGWSLTPEQVKKLDAASDVTPIYPYWHQRATFAERNPPPVG
jgi:aryl-alcohol dehydrogenase-like predicted oxidoreductase